MNDTAAVIGLVGVFVGWGLKTCSEFWSQRRLFDQRLRLEKEYQLYIELWDRFFELRRTLGTAISPCTHTEDMPDDEHIRSHFNDYQSVVSRGEPFYSRAIYRLVREVLLPSRKIVKNCQQIANLKQQQADNRVEINRLEDENKESYELVDSNFDKTSAEIRKRAGPP